MHNEAGQQRCEYRIRGKTPLLLGALTLCLFLAHGSTWLSDPMQLVERTVLSVWLLAAIAFCIFGVVRHADALADLLGEPVGTLILTISVILIEVSLKAALANKLQRSINPCLRSALSTVAPTVPLVLMIGLATGQTVTLGLDDENILLLMLMLMVSMLTFSGARTNVLHGAVHLLLFFTYVVLIINP